MRYTLRLLTRDQFIRATRLICALELIRRERGELGAEPISIGLWVGQATSPNTFSKAAERVNEALASDEKPELVLDHCPWCGQNFAPGRNYDSGERHFHFLCRDQRCGFGASGDGVLPCNVVDEALYAKPPTMLAELGNWMNEGEISAHADIRARLFWGVIQKLVRAQTQDHGPAPVDVALAHLENQLDRLPETAYRPHLERLITDMRACFGLAGATVTELFEQHKGSLSRPLLLFCLRRHSTELLEFSHP